MSRMSEIDQLLQDVVARASDGLNFDVATGAITDGVQAIAAQLKALAVAKYDKVKPAETSRCVAQTTRALDDLFRLLQFAKGAPDSRPDLGGDWLRGLTEQQLRDVQRMVEQNAKAAEQG